MSDLIERLTECIAFERSLSAPAEGSIAAMEDAATRIKELEAEVKRDQQAFEQQEARHLENVAKWREHISKLEAERSELIESIRAERNEAYEQGKYEGETATIERCKKTIKALKVDECHSDLTDHWNAALDEAIRALKPAAEQGK